MRGQQRATRVLFVAQGLSLAAMSVDLTVTALVGSELAPFAWMATIPIALIALGTVFANTFVNRLIARIGHKHVFETGAVIAICGGISSFCAVWFHNFPLLCVGTFAVGIYQAASNYYRYAAADLNPGKKDRAVSVVLSAGVIAAIVGPLLATWAEGLFPVHYAGSYLIVSILGILALATVAMFPADQQIGGMRQPVGSAQKVGLLELLRRPRFLLGIALGFTVCCAMTMIMAGAPLVMEHVLRESDGTRMQAMQLHMLGMYLPMALIPLLNSKKRSHTVFVSLCSRARSCQLSVGSRSERSARRDGIAGHRRRLGTRLQRGHGAAGELVFRRRSGAGQRQGRVLPRMRTGHRQSVGRLRHRIPRMADHAGDPDAAVCADIRYRHQQSKGYRLALIR